jgi:predicted AlkP superfamily pyrophosphatase or phosphodiesterase
MTIRRARRAQGLALALLYALAVAPRAHAAMPAPAEDDLATAHRPRLVVALLFDQYRGDYLDKYASAFGPDGFRRLLREGADFRDCTIPYAHTLTGPGHATWLSGAPPSVHGVVANEWFDEGLGRSVSASGDASVQCVGVPPPGDPNSPRQMRAQTVADVLRTETHGEARVVAMSDKARGAVLPAGRRPNGVYWLDTTSSLMQTSTYYTSAMPAWAARANAAVARAADAAKQDAWTPLLSAAAYRGTIPADAEDTFPHPVKRDKDDPRPNAVPLDTNPFALDRLFDFAEAAVVGESLGADDVPDLLIVSVSVTDYVGHRYGPDSPEALDMAARADRRLAEFLSFLDAHVGRGRYDVTVTADHGVAPVAALARRFAAAPFDSVGSLRDSTERHWIDRVVGGPGARGVARSIANGDITFNADTLAALHLTRAEAARALADSAFASPWFEAGYTADELRNAPPGNDPRGRLACGSMPGRSGDVSLVVRTDAILGWSRETRASHGTPWRYDVHVPFVLFGAGVKPGTYRGPVSTLDIAPTVAALLGVEPPAQCQGHARIVALLP